MNPYRIETQAHEAWERVQLFRMQEGLTDETLRDLIDVILEAHNKDVQELEARIQELERELVIADATVEELRTERSELRQEKKKLNEALVKAAVTT